MSVNTRNRIRRQLQNLFSQHLGISPSVSRALVPPNLLAGKLYEAHVLSRVVEHLAIDEGYSMTLVGGIKVQLKRAAGPINRSYPRIELHRSELFIAELWTDIEFLSMSYCEGASTVLTKGDYHELDIVIVPVGVSGRPTFVQVLLGIERKNTGFEKGLLKEILGVRRELSLLASPQPTMFHTWPRTTVPASPPSCLLVYSTDAKVTEYAAPGIFFGIDFVHEAM